MQYFRPPSPHFVGDCMPFYREGVFSLYWLLDENHSTARGGRGGHQWALSTTRDLVNWTHHGLVIPIEADWEGSICTGSTFYHDGVYYGFYATRKMDGTEHLSVATSADGILFRKQEPNPFASPGPGLIPGAYRDPCVFLEEATGLFHMIVTARLENSPLAEREGFLEHLVSRDLRNWKVVEPFLLPNLIGTPECSDYFHWNGWYYLLFSCWGMARYRMSRGPLGPWTTPAVDTFNGGMASVMKTAAFTGGRRIGVSFLPWLESPASNDKWCYAGNMVFQEILQQPDGTLLSRFVPEMTPQGGPSVSPAFEPVTPMAKIGEGIVEFDAPASRAAARMLQTPRDAHVTLRIDPRGAACVYGLCLRADEHCANGADIRICPANRTVEVRSPANGIISPLPWHSLVAVDGLDRPVSLEIVIKEDILDICLNDRRCLVNRIPKLDGRSIFLYCQNGAATFRSIAIRPL